MNNATVLQINKQENLSLNMLKITQLVAVHCPDIKEDMKDGKHEA